MDMETLDSSHLVTKSSEPDSSWMRDKMENNIERRNVDDINDIL